MSEEHIQQLKTVLEQIENPSPKEFTTITTLFNRFRDKWKTNFYHIKLTHLQMLYHLKERVAEYTLLRDLTTAINIDVLRGVINKVLLGWLFEIISTIKQYDLAGYEMAGFNLTNLELKTLEAFRNMTFHIPDDNKVYFFRSFIVWLWMDEIVGRVDELDHALRRYMDYQKKFEQLVIEQGIKDTTNSQDLKEMTDDYFGPIVSDADIQRMHHEVLEFNKKHNLK